MEALLIRNALLQDTPLELVAVAEQGFKVAYSHAFRIACLVTIAFGVVGTIFVAFPRNVDDKMTSQMDIKLYEGPHLRGLKDTGGSHIIMPS